MENHHHLDTIDAKVTQAHATVLSLKHNWTGDDFTLRPEHVYGVIATIEELLRQAGESLSGLAEAQMPAAPPSDMPTQAPVQEAA